MTTYDVVAGTGSDFAIEITSNGVRQTLLGFKTEADAYSWIEEDRVREQAYLSTGE